MTKPLSPADITAAKRETIPPMVIEVVNRLLATNWSGQSATVEKQAVMAELKKYFTEKQIFEGHYLDFEENYRAVGWTVVYDKPGYDESYEARYVFTEFDRARC